MNRLLIIGLVIAVSLSGCAKEAEDPSQDDAESPASVGEPGNEFEAGNETQAPVNTPPSAILQADIQQGVVPFDVTFTVNGTDADGDSLTWSLDANGDGQEDRNGTEFPSQAIFTYDAPATYQATLSVSDGKNVTTTTLTINGTAAVEETGPAQTASGTIVTSPYGCLQNAYLNGPANPYFVLVTVLEASYGLPFKATFTTTVPSIMNAAQFWIGSSTVAGTFSSDTSEVTGVVPPNSGSLYLSSCGGAQVEVYYQAGGF